MEEDLITFDGQRLYAGIAYHVRQPSMPFWEKGRCTGISTDSMMSLQTRLLLRFKPLLVHRNEWRALSDVDRLVWLLEAANTKGQYIKGSSIIELVEDGTEHRSEAD